MMRQIVLFAAAAAAVGTLAAPRLAAQTLEPPTIRVTATGEARAPADRAVADFAVETTATTAREAAAENARRMEQVMAALTRAGIPRDRIETRDYSVFPEYDHRPGMEREEPRIRGYRVSNTVQVTTEDVTQVGALIDAALGAGANRISGVRFGLRDPQAVRRRAIEDAVSRARADAEAMAGALGVRLGSIRVATTGDGGGAAPPMYAMEARMAGDMATPVNPSEQVVRASVSVAFEIVP